MKAYWPDSSVKDMALTLYKAMPGAPMPDCPWEQMDRNGHWDFCENIATAILVLRGDGDLIPMVIRKEAV